MVGFSTEQDALAPRVEDDEVLDEDGGALFLAGHRLPRTDDPALEVFANRHAGDKRESRRQYVGQETYEWIRTEVSQRASL